MLLVKHKRIIKEFNTLKIKNPGLSQLVWDLTGYIKDNMNKDVIMTELYRTKAMQKKYYGIKTKKRSNHQSWKAVDIRHWIYNDNEIKLIISFLKGYDKYNRLSIMRKGKNSSRTVLLHSIGRGKHFHIQYNGPKVQMVRFDKGITISV